MKLPSIFRYGVMEDELLYGLNDTEKQIPYDPNYPISPTMYRLNNPYGSKTYLSRTSDYGYSPTKYLNQDNIYGSRDFRDGVTREHENYPTRDFRDGVTREDNYPTRDYRDGVATREHENFPPRDFRDSGIATMLKNDYQRKIEYGEYNDRMSEGSDKHLAHDKYLFPYTGEFTYFLFCADFKLV